MKRVRERESTWEEKSKGNREKKGVVTMRKKRVEIERAYESIIVKKKKKRNRSDVEMVRNGTLGI